MKIQAAPSPTPRSLKQQPPAPPPPPADPKESTVLGRALEPLPGYARGAVIGAGTLAPAMVGGVVGGLPGALVGGVASLGFQVALDGDVKRALPAAGWATVLGTLAGSSMAAPTPLRLGLAVGVSGLMGALAVAVQKHSEEQGPLRHINKPGQDVDVEKKLIPGKTNIVCFSASWCPACQEAEPKLKALGTEKPEYVTLKVDIDNGDSPVAKHYGIKRIPCYRVYDGEGKLVSDGTDARTLVRGWLGQEP